MHIARVTPRNTHKLCTWLRLLNLWSCIKLCANLAYLRYMQDSILEKIIFDSCNLCKIKAKEAKQSGQNIQNVQMR